MKVGKGSHPACYEGCRYYMDERQTVHRDAKEELATSARKELDVLRKGAVPGHAADEFGEEPFLGVDVARVRAAFDVLRCLEDEVLESRADRWSGGGRA